MSINSIVKSRSSKENFTLEPTIKVSQARSKSSVPEMHITFADGHEDKLILHRHFISGAESMMDEQMGCNYLGHLEKDASLVLQSLVVLAKTWN